MADAHPTDDTGVYPLFAEEESYRFFLLGYLHQAIVAV